jgi:hypothetical protein
MVKEEFHFDLAQTNLMPGFSDIPTLSHLHTSVPNSHSAHLLAAISTNPQQSLLQQAL